MAMMIKNENINGRLRTNAQWRILIVAITVCYFFDTTFLVSQSLVTNGFFQIDNTKIGGVFFHQSSTLMHFTYCN